MRYRSGLAGKRHKVRVYSEEVTASHSFTKQGKNLIYTVLIQAPLPRSAVGYDDDSLQNYPLQAVPVKGILLHLLAFLQFDAVQTKFKRQRHHYVHRFAIY